MLDIQITNASLKDILGTLGATMEEGSWVTTSYLVAEIVVIPLTGWLATVFGLGMYGVMYVLPVYLAQIQGYNAAQIGRTIMWSGVPQLRLMPVAALLAKRWDLRLFVSVGLALFATSCLMNGCLTHWTAHEQLRTIQLIRALEVFDHTVRREAFVLAFGDTFTLLGVILLMAIPLVWRIRLCVEAASHGVPAHPIKSRQGSLCERLTDGFALQQSGSISAERSLLRRWIKRRQQAVFPPCGWWRRSICRPLASILRSTS